MGKSYYNYLVSFSAAMGGLLFGYEIGVVSQVLSMDSFGTFFGSKQYFPSNNSFLEIGDVAKDVDGNVTFTFLAGCLVGAAIASMLADFIGRKWSIIAGGGFFTAGGLLQSLANTHGLFYGGRVVSGLGIGILSTTAPLYIAEAAPTELRGRMVAIQQLMVTIGIFIASCINSVILVTVSNTSDMQWRYALGVQMIPGVILLAVMFFMPYSPRWLASKDRNAETLQVLSKLRNEDPSSDIVQDEYNEIREGIEAEKEIGTASWTELLKPGLINRVLIVVVLQFWQQWTGINVILYYQNSLFVKMGFDPKAAAIPFTIANNFINFIATFPGMYLVEKWGRRKLLIIGGVGIGVAHLLVFFSLGLSDSVNAKFAWGAVVSIYLFFISFASTWGPVVWVYQSEIFPLRVRAKGTGIGTMSNWANNAIIAKISPIITYHIKSYQYLIFAGCGLAMALFSMAFVPETMGKSLEEMDYLFGSTSRPPSPHKQHKIDN